MPKGDKPTLKQKEFAKLYVQTGNATEAAVQVYDVGNRNTAQALGSENLAKPIVQAEIDSLTQTMREITSNALQEAIAHARKDLAHSDEKVQREARKFLLDCTLAFSAPKEVPRTAVQNNRYYLPKR